MEKLSEMFKKLWAKFKSLGKVLKIAIVVGLVSTLVAIIVFITMSMGNKYQVLFSNLDPRDAQLITSKLKEQKVDVKIEGETILVPKEKVDSLRLELAPEISSGSQGYELMDNSSSFGMTDEEFKIKKLRMQQGELEKTIKSFPQVENARVHITPSKDSVFIQDKEPGKAAVTLKLTPGQTLTEEQVKSIVALVSGSTENIPKENIEVIDDKMNLLTAHINNGGEEGTGGVSAETISNHQKLEKDFETKLEREIVKLLEPVIGKGKVNTSVAVDLDFDSKKKTETTIDPNKVIVSQELNREETTGNTGADSNSPVDNNMSPTIGNSNGNSSSIKDGSTTNYESGKSETVTISAPGEVRRMTTSVFVDGVLDAGTKDTLEDAIGSAIGINIERGDKISVVGMQFDPTTKDDAQKEIDAMNAQVKREQFMRIGMIALAVLGVIAIIITLIIIMRRRKEKQDERALDVVIDDNTLNKEPKRYAPIDFEVDDEKAHRENEIKKYAKDKPDQVVDIIKSWMQENER
ncbi:MAG: flagellar basal-body MS-ring/collar protein FliF [Clostridium sp.]